MGKPAHIRIAERKRLSEWYNQDRNVVSRAFGKMGLWAADAWDRMTAPLNSDSASFLGNTAFGAAKGATIGTVVGITLALFVAGNAAAAVLPTYAAVCAGIGAIALGISHGQSGLEKHWAHSQRHFSDSIAETLGAVPSREKLRQMEKNPPPPPLKPNRPEQVVASAEEETNIHRDRAQQQAVLRRGPTILN